MSSSDLWPLAGRETELDLVGRALRSRQGRGFVVAGGPGVGKSRLAVEAAAGQPTRRIAGTRCGAALPFAAFASWLPAGGGLRELMAVLRRGADRPVLIVDDADLLDPASAALVHQLALHREVRLVLTVADAAGAPDAVTALWKDGLLPRLCLTPLPTDVLSEILAGALGGQVEQRTVRRLASIVDGDLRMLRELVDAGALTRRAGVWGLHGTPVINGRIRELISARFGDLTDADWEDLTCAAFGGPPTERLEAVLTADGAVPYAEIVRTMSGPLRARRIKRRLAATVDPLRAATWALEDGDPVDAALLAEGTRRALAVLDVPLAARLGRAAVDAGAPASLLDQVQAFAAYPAVLHQEHDRLTSAVLAGDLTVQPAVGADAEWDVAAAAYCGQQARLCRLRGRPRDALTWSREGVSHTPTALCLGELAHAGALLGDVATARQALAHAAQVGSHMSVELARTWALAATGDRSGAIHAALAVTGAGRLFALHDVVRLGAAELVADRLDRCAGSFGGSFAALLARHAAAAATMDGATLDIVAKEFEALGFLLHAAEAHAQAAAAHGRAGEPRRARAAIVHGWQLGRNCQGARTPALTTLAAPQLTLRQREIAQLAAAGLSNREIAQRLTVSIRTVANHLCGIYDRLGVHDRAGLSRLLAGLQVE